MRMPYISTNCRLRRQSLKTFKIPHSLSKVQVTFADMTIQFLTVTPILRILDIPKADEFYQNFLGFKVDWDHRFADDLPLYRQVSRDGLVLHLSEHHGDGTPGANIRVTMTGLAQFHTELTEKKYRYMRPGIEDGPAPGSKEMTVHDPFGNRITFCEHAKEDE